MTIVKRNEVKGHYIDFFWAIQGNEKSQSISCLQSSIEIKCAKSSFGEVGQRGTLFIIIV